MTTALQLYREGPVGRANAWQALSFTAAYTYHCLAALESMGFNYVYSLHLTGKARRMEDACDEAACSPRPWEPYARALADVDRWGIDESVAYYKRRWPDGSVVVWQDGTRVAQT